MQTALHLSGQIMQMLLWKGKLKEKGVDCCTVACRGYTSVTMFLLRVRRSHWNVQGEAAKPQVSQNFTWNQLTSRDSSIWISFLLRPRTLKKQRTNTLAFKKSTHFRKEASYRRGTRKAFYTLDCQNEDIELWSTKMWFLHLFAQTAQTED
jgi:hypothetical protein